MKKITCAVIGCGRIGCGFDDDNKSKKPLTHSRTYILNPKTELVSLCDEDKNKLKKYGQKFQIKNLYQSSSELLQNEKIECLSICTFANSHLELVRQAANNKVKGIFLEKPIADNLSNARKIIEICKKNNIRLLIDHQRRFHSLYQYVKKFIQHKKLGNIQLVNIYYGGGISNTGTHVFDLLRYFFGEVKSLQAHLSNNKSQNPHDLNLEIDLIFVNDIQGRMQALDTKNYGILELDIFGTKGRIRLDLINNKIEYFQISKNASYVYKMMNRSRFKTSKMKNSEIFLGIENLVTSIIKNEKLLCTGEDGYKSLELSIASMISYKSNKSIHLPLKKNSFKILSQ